MPIDFSNPHSSSAVPAQPATPAASATNIVKPGWQTTEFWLTVGGAIVALVPQAGVPAWAAYLLGAAYAVARGIAKKG